MNKLESLGEELGGLAGEMLRELQRILTHERKHFNFYLQASMEVQGLERVYLKPLFEREMNGELDHIRAFGDKIVAMGGSPTREIQPFSFGGGLGAKWSAANWLNAAVSMEREVLKIYHELYPKAEKYAEIFGDMSIVLLLEENIEHTTADVEEMEKILGIV